jgi:hypothetical protein
MRRRAAWPRSGGERGESVVRRGGADGAGDGVWSCGSRAAVAEGGGRRARRRAEEDAMGGGGGGVTRAHMRLRRVQRTGAEEEVEAAKGGRRRAHPVGAWGECPVGLPAERPRGGTTERRCPYAFFRVEKQN